MAQKKNIQAFCIQFLENKIKELNNAVSDLEADAANDSKSSAGDKHETGRAMMQLEQEKLSKQISELSMQLEDVRKTDTDAVHEKAGKGSLIKCNRGTFYISVSLGKLEIDKESVFVLSAGSPLGKMFLGLGKGQGFDLNGVNYQIQKIS